MDEIDNDLIALLTQEQLNVVNNTQCQNGGALVIFFHYKNNTNYIVNTHMFAGGTWHSRNWKNYVGFKKTTTTP